MSMHSASAGYAKWVAHVVHDFGGAYAEARSRQSMGLVGVAVVSVFGVASAIGGSSARPALRPWGFGDGRATPVQAPHLTRARTIILRAGDFVTTAVDNDPAGTSQGDQIIVNGTLTKRRSDRPVGGLQATETFTELPADGERACCSPSPPCCYPARSPLAA
jgi:hypothetical protein